jgi:hypothetical protein
VTGEFGAVEQTAAGQLRFMIISGPLTAEISDGIEPGLIDRDRDRTDTPTRRPAWAR